MPRFAVPTTRTSLNADRLFQFSAWNSGSGAVRGGGEPVALGERLPQRLGRAKAGPVRDRGQREVGRLQQPGRRLGARGPHVGRRGLAQVRTPAMAAAAFGLLRTPPGRVAAARVLFGDRSFPDPGVGAPG